jgi:hypothetical protein
MKKRFILIITITVFGATKTNAQVTTNERVLKLSSQYLKLEHQLNYARALSLAKEKKWELSITLKDGNMAKLSGVDEFGFPTYIKSFNNTIAAATTKASALWNGGASGLNLSGNSTSMTNKLGIWEFDGVPLATHVEFGTRINQRDNATGGTGNNHATHVAGTMIASGVNPIAKGMAYGIPNLLAYEYTNDLSEMTAEGASGLLLSNHSYGLVAGWDYNTSQTRWQFYGRPGENEDYRYGFYSRDASLIDSIAYNAPNYLIVSSAGNDRNNNGPAVGEPYYRYDANFNFVSAGNRPSGISSNDSYDIITGYGIAKNNLTVGAVNGIPGGWNKPGDVVMSAFSGWGPTDDGRIKPDLVGHGVSVTSSSSNANNAYATLSGTSMSAPNVTGSLTLLQEYYNRLKAGNFMRSSTLKGLAIHTTDEAGATPGPDYQFGWGLLNVQRGASVLTNAVGTNNANTSSDLLFENILSNGGTFTRTVVATGRVPLSATICWTDPVGTVNTNAISNLNDRTKKLVHDLDIRITSGARTYFPWTLDAANPSLAAQRGDNSTDNVEKVGIDSTIPGQTYTITVTHKGTLARGSQAYALLVSGVGGTAYCTSTSGGGGARIDSVKFSNINYGNTAGCKTYTDNTTFSGDIQPLQVLPITVSVSTCDATTNNRFVKVFIDYNNNGVFDATELVATSGSLSSAAQNFTANITVPSTVVIGTSTLMRIIVQEAATANDVIACGTYGKGETQDFRVKIVMPTNDMSVSSIVSPQGGDCANTQQYITTTLYNAGTGSQSNIPITATVLQGSTTIATINAIYPGNIAGQSSANYTFQTPFDAVAGASYTITITTNLAGDANSGNNSTSATVAIAAVAASPNAEGAVCNTNANLRVLNPIASTNYFWYTSNTNTATPIGSGSIFTSGFVPTDRTFYVKKEARGTVGAASKLTFPNGGYNSFAGNFMTFNNAVPLKIETVRLYIGNAGQVRVTLGDNLTPSATAGSYSYRPLASSTFDVFATSPNPTPGAVTGNDPLDSGAVYFLNFNLTTTGEKILIVECLNGATIFRNNGITGTTYPTAISGIMTYTGNSASLSTGTNANQFYYFFYDTRVSTGCQSAFVPVIATANIPLSASQVGDSLISSITTGTFQWTYNDTAIVANSNSRSIKPTRSGNYKVTVVDGFNCSRTSANINYTVTAVINASAQEIGLKVTPNPGNGIFQVSFDVTSRADLVLDILNSSGQSVYRNTQSNFIGRYIKQISLPQAGSGVHLLKISHNRKVYTAKIIIQR